MGKSKHRIAWEQMMRSFHTEAKGQMQTMVYRPEHALATILANPEPFEVGLLRAVANWFQQASKAPKPMLCLTCDRVPNPPPAFVITLPADANPKQSIVCGLCDLCADRDDAVILHRALIKMREIWPDLHTIQRN